MHNTHKTLAEILVSVPHADREQFNDLGDGNVHIMSLAAMEKYLYPTLYLMRYLHEHTGKNLIGVVES
jgi:hypothetical protein